MTTTGEGTSDEIVRAAPSLSSASHRSGKNGAGIAAIPLSPLDEALFLRPMLIPWAFFFRGQLEASKLKAALSLALHKFPLLAGRIRPSRPTPTAPLAERLTSREFALSNEGIIFDEFECSATADDYDFFGSSARLAQQLTIPVDNFNPPEFCPKMIAKRVWAGEEPLLRVRLTTLAGGSGCIVGITASHIAVDGASLVAFLEYWARKCQDLAVSPPSSEVIFSPGRIPPESPLYRAGPSFDREELRQAVIGAALLPPPFPPGSSSSASSLHTPVSTPAGGGTPNVSSSGEEDDSSTAAAAEEEKAKREGAAADSASSRAGARAGVDVVPTAAPRAAAAAAEEEKEGQAGCGGYSTEGARGSFPYFKLITKVARIAKDAYLGKQVSIVVRVSADEVRRLKAAAAKALGPGEFVSSNDVMMAFAWALARAARGRKDKDSTVVPGRCILIQTINLRKHLPGLSTSYFGNCAWAIPALAPTSAPLSSLAKHVREGVVAATAASTGGGRGAAARAIVNLFITKDGAGDAAVAAAENSGIKTPPPADTTSKVVTTLVPVFSEGMASSLSFDGAFWRLDFGAGKPFWFWGGIFPFVPWGFAIVQGPQVAAAAAAAPVGRANKTEPTRGSVVSPSADDDVSPGGLPPIKTGVAGGGGVQQQGGGGGTDFLIFCAVPAKQAEMVREVARTVLNEMLRGDAE